MQVLPRVIGCVVLLGAGRVLGEEAGGEESGVTPPTSTEETTATATSTGKPRVTLSFTLKAGTTDEAEKHGRGAGGIESAVLLGEKVQGGVRLLLDANSEDATVGGAFTLGASLPVGATTRLDLHGDLGVTRYSRDYDATVIVASEGIRGSTAVVPTLGFRAGLTFVRERGRAVTLGGFVRSAARREVHYTVQTCALLFCSEEPRSVRYGGTTVGGFLTLGFAMGGG